MTGRRGRPKTTGKSLNKKTNTCTSARTNTETSMSVSKKTKSAIPLTNFFKPTSSAMNKSINNPVNNPANSPTNIRVDSPVHSPTEHKTEKGRRKNRTFIKKFLKTVYFVAKKKWAVKNNFEDMINFPSDIGVEDIKLHIENAPQNDIYTSITSAEQFLKAIGDYLNEQLVTDLLAAGEFSVLSDKSKDEGDRSLMEEFICFVNITSHKVQERFLGGG